jgi:hypothetical protein
MNPIRRGIQGSTFIRERLLPQRVDQTRRLKPIMESKYGPDKESKNHIPKRELPLQEGSPNVKLRNPTPRESLFHKGGGDTELNDHIPNGELSLIRNL